MYMYLINGKDFLGSLLVLSMLLTWSVLRENGGLHLHFCDSFPFAYNQLNHILSRGYHLQGPICFTKKSEQAIRELAANQQKPFQRMNFRSVNTFDRTLRSHGTFRYFRSV